MKILASVWRFLRFNRFVMIGLVVGFLFWIGAISCTPKTESPYTPGKMVDARQLQIEFKTWQAWVEVTAARFEAAGQDLQEQKERLNKAGQWLIAAATGVTDWPALIQILFYGGGLGAIADNIGKRGVIAGLKRNEGTSKLTANC